MIWGFDMKAFDIGAARVLGLAWGFKKQVLYGFIGAIRARYYSL